AGPRIAPVHCAAGSDGDTNFGVTLLAAPNAASSRVARYSFAARLTSCGSSSLLHFVPGIDRCLLASATMRLASTAKPSPPTKPALMHASTTRSNTVRKRSLSRNRSLRTRENAEWSGNPDGNLALQQAADRPSTIRYWRSEDSGSGTADAIQTARVHIAARLRGNRFAACGARTSG